MKSATPLFVILGIALSGCNTSGTSTGSTSGPERPFEGFRFEPLPRVGYSGSEKYIDRPTNFENYTPTTGDRLLGGSIATCSNTPADLKKPASPDVNLPYKLGETLTGSVGCDLGGESLPASYTTSWTVNGNVHSFSGRGSIARAGGGDIVENFKVEVRGDKCKLLSYTRNETQLGTYKLQVRMSPATKCFVFGTK